jgi:hypothetical protein
MLNPLLISTYITNDLHSLYCFAYLNWATQESGTRRAWTQRVTTLLVVNSIGPKTQDGLEPGFGEHPISKRMPTDIAKRKS